MPTDLRTCKWCGVRVIFPVTAEGEKLPPVNYGPDPLGELAVTHEVTGEWRGRFLATGEQATPAEARHAEHDCDGLRRQRQRGRWKAARAEHAAGLRRGHRQPAPELPGMTRLWPGGDSRA